MKMEADDNKAERAKHQTMLDAMESELAKMERKRKKLFLDYEDEVYSRDEFIERKQHYNQAIDEIKKQIQEAQNAIPEPVDYSERIVTLHAMIECVKDPDLSAKKKNDFLKQFVDRITYDSINYGQRKGGKAVLEVFLK
jgi:DNA repair ATPase RecN